MQRYFFAAVVLLSVAICTIPALGWFIVFWPAESSLKTAIADALMEAAGSRDSGRYDWECRWNCADHEWLHDLPPLSKVTCYDRLARNGACCGAEFNGGSFRLYSEIHVFWLANGRYKISFYSHPMCTTPNYDDPQRDPSERDPFFRCDERWRTDATQGS